MADVRSIILEDFDEDMLPNGSKDFAIKLSQSGRLSSKREVQVKAWAILDQDVTIQAKACGCDDHNKRPSASFDDRERSKRLRKAGSVFVKEESEDDYSDDEDCSGVEPSTVFENASATYDQAVQDSRQLMKSCEKILTHPENQPFFSSKASGLEEELNTWLGKNPPHTTICCLGATGVGKSSLLNALLDEASVLPTSGSRGCTAAVVELCFNQDLVDASSDETSVYKAQVEFMSLQEWLEELQILLNECCNPENNIVRRPDSRRDLDAASSWDKIEQVYGRRTLSLLLGKPKEEAWGVLKDDTRVLKLLGRDDGGVNTVVVQEGTVNSAEAKLLCGPLSDLNKANKELAKRKSCFAESFRRKINDYVYGEGNGEGPQTWPLIRKCVLFGPWPLLSLGGRLVDLPGIQDSNSTRAKVAETYRQQCDFIWIVAPVKRAVDDSIAKELLGDQFKRQLLMDGQYCNVRFICTQTDDCEPNEIMQDHEDVARKENGRWDRMKEMRDEIAHISTQIEAINEEKESLSKKLRKLRHEVRDINLRMKAKEEDDAEDLVGLRDEKKSHINYLNEQIALKKENIQNLEKRSQDLQKALKAVAAIIRNEYSTARMQIDFRAGLEELVNPVGEEELEHPHVRQNESLPPPLPDNFQLNVNCISANDYLKLKKLKSSSDGKPSTFSSPDQTQIPALCGAVHETTLQYRRFFAQKLAKKAGNLLELMCQSVAETRSTKTPGGLKQAFDEEMRDFATAMDSLVSEFVHKAQSEVEKSLEPAMRSGASKSASCATSTASSWGSKENGLRYPSYQAAVRRAGEYYSKAKGLINFNRSLYDPMEEKFSAAWQRTMDTAMRGFLESSKKNAKQTVVGALESLFVQFTGAGLNADLVSSMRHRAYRICMEDVDNSFEFIMKKLIEKQRKLNRSLLPNVARRMGPGYEAAAAVERGPGAFSRMKHVLCQHADDASRDMFHQTVSEALDSVPSIIHHVSTNIKRLAKIIHTHMDRVFSVWWVSQATIPPPFPEPIVKNTRRDLQHQLDDLCKVHCATLEKIGVDKEGMVESCFK
eukprot:CAMPEP_0168755338 /NCGR_PEP_ID=MMETSP0724-20121128/20012_1 /TAXON_ID=265536 /ORGANISM="Amphiprora sp., Strain CCMP467" /LENGTH=1052 /DNA_ID=CAMNT_0008803939 /DNA_START=109 /DNA_END=3267 /DNA_ORIENTATION=-